MLVSWPTDTFIAGVVTRGRLPIGIRSFREVRERSCYYVDKTAYLARLADGAKSYVLSRPPGFGKSVLLDTLAELFAGSEPLFAGLAVHENWDWSVRHPVVRLSFGGGTFRHEDDLPRAVADQLAATEADAAIAAGPTTFAGRLDSIISTLHERTGQRVVVLVDDHDRPVLDALPVPRVARANRDLLCGLYLVVKDCDAHVHFSFFTGVGRFATDLFSGLNNLLDISLERRNAAICGYTDADLDATFAAELPGLDRDEIRSWYGGYRWVGDEEIYNPLGILRLFRERRFDGSWFDAAAPAFLIDMLIERGVDADALDDRICDGRMLSLFDPDNVVMETLLFQSGCITITGTEDLGGETLYRLGYPNREVRRRLGERLRAGAADPA
ncbi:MAG: AAA family ATPase [Acidobacteria bacterium]|nr:AAA family ATPase [Acidobacteriota bacterium]